MNQKIIIFLIGVLIILSIFISGCGSMTVSELNSNKEEYLGKELSVSGIVGSTMKLGSLSGYSLVDEKTGETLVVKSNSLPEEGKKITVKGTLMKDLMFYYLLVHD
ncbi:hypothetical protein J4465_02930 [Candidatus Pacearchaeota archaeon]|nr:hypothetical protein [Candidatus Pacearchaeota archaeon]